MHVSHHQGLADATTSGEDLDALVIGAGFSGIRMLHRLRASGLRVRVLEGAPDVGGTWFWNGYPGARCDSPHFHFGYFFSPELEQEWNWSERFPSQAEVLRYLNHVVDRFDLRRDMQFDTWVTAARYSDEERVWYVETSRGQRFRARFCITAVGVLSLPNKPSLPGIDRFRGAIYHTGRWPREPVNFTGKRVGVIGTGASGIQAIPEIAKEAKHLTVFQRTANYTAPAGNHPLTDEFRAQMKARIREVREADRYSDNGVHDYVTINDVSIFDVTPEERERALEAAWRRGGFSMLQVFKDVTSNPDANRIVADFVRGKIRSIVRDPETARKLMPTDHPLGGRRMPIDTGYFETFNRDNVTLVDVRSAPISEITETGLQTSEASYELDVIVFATGFDALTGSILKLNVHGRDGQALKDKWADGPVSYLGVQCHGFPNFFIMVGPNSPSVFSNVPVSVEQHAEWIGDCIDYVLRNEIVEIEADPEAERRWGEHVEEIGRQSIYGTTNSWYNGANIPGKPRAFLGYVGGVGQYRKLCDEVAAEGYRGFILHRGPAPKGRGSRSP